MAPKIAIVYYSMYGHVAKLAEAEKKGIEEAGGSVDVYQIEETLPKEVLSKMHAPGPNTNIPFITPDVLKTYDAFLFGIPTRYGNYSAQWKAFIDKLGGLWQQGALYGKYYGMFISTGTAGGGQESTALAAISSWVHQGMIYVPFGYAKAFPLLADLSEVRGGSPWGAGTFASADGSRQPSAKELEMATIQGKAFYETVSKVNFA
ncbi:NAD(P)H:quinone oxidoreductase, type IV [Rhinocladiella mackenziei CBS 650.93]|uniref:NAD(P)H:quinone oxidoreductase, type IV n=1 Tax=Rhinocladiella mackenziei CBS 650.93 TaxID=1442369 RepID=A0A0D2ILE5_9EURO|nr:NAD(P)H:quinone oxidoreductase, type IV [Rhinocladiella mackenziei CBS 650.93]KIX06519.1 NAD(P)H:quinone oxidoreductase, type IV [Rhinocladiella mackenziei CBS 650.93]